jgi:hypothetical protein
MAFNPVLRIHALFDIQSDADIFWGGGVPLVDNLGTIVKSGGGVDATNITVDVSNQGILRAQSGTLHFGGAYLQTAGETVLAGGAISKSGAALEIRGGLLTGFGTITGNVQVGSCSTTPCGGTLAPGASPGQLAIDGEYTQAADGTLAIELGGATPIAEHDLLTVSGTASLDGSLSVMFLNGFTPGPGQSFTILTAGTVNGSFAAVELINPPPGLAMNVVYEPGQVRLVVPGGPVMRGDMNCDGAVDLLDIEPFALALVNADAYSAAYPLCNPMNADMNVDAVADGRDVPDFVLELLP